MATTTIFSPIHRGELLHILSYKYQDCIVNRIYSDYKNES